MAGSHIIKLHYEEHHEPLGARCITQRVEVEPLDQLEVRIKEDQIRVLRVVK